MSTEAHTSKVVVGLSVSLDGYIAGPGDGPAAPLGAGGSQLFEWWTAGTEPMLGDDRFRPPAQSRAAVEEAFACGAVITGRRTFDIAQGWGGQHPVGVPFFLLTHNPPDRWVGPGTGGTVITDGIEPALAAARAVAGGRPIGSSAPTSRSSTCGPACSTRSTSTWCRCCWAAASGCSMTWRAASTGCPAPGWSNPTG